MILVAAFFALQLLAHGPNLVRAVTQGKDASVKFVPGESQPQQFNIRVAPASSSRSKPGVCRGTMIATVTGGRLTRAIIAGQEQLLDTAWSTDYEVEAGKRLSQPYRFLDPIGGAQVACRKGWVSCHRDGPVTGSASCDMDGRLDNRDSRKSGKPRIKIRAPHIVMGRGGAGGAAPVRIYVDILGELTEEWWCPEIIVEWPDDTRSKREGDCDPFTGAPDQVAKGQTWSFSHWLAPGPNIIRVRVLRNGSQIGATEHKVRVVGGAQ